MAEHYSSLYQTPPNANAGTAPVYKGPFGENVGQIYGVFGTYSNVAALPFGGGTLDSMHLCEVPENAKLIGFSAIASADMDTNNDFTFNLGFTGALTGFASASTGLQATTAFAPAESALMVVAASAINPANKSELLLNRAAGSLEAAGTLTFFATFLMP